MKISQNKLKVFFDGSCHLCDREIKYYLKKDTNNVLIPVNIMAKDFVASKYGLDHNQVNLHLHAIDEEGTVFKKVDTFIQIWLRIPKFNYLAKLASKKSVKWGLDKSYIVFAEFIRPYLPKKKCTDEHCEL